MTNIDCIKKIYTPALGRIINKQIPSNNTFQAIQIGASSPHGCSSVGQESGRVQLDKSLEDHDWHQHFVKYSPSY
ncbi:hypothetical protein MA16_Dca006885 [Dendrobium catenatum]|uniref:Uncharacterized protein n=1 Tax=Dendrobium catenatum TaxID=906689 RepID=A0A2I0VT18_9ASPA|nr:hypothetical protein MA16_Dca006885 [Dendrobium catenatum]